MTNSFPEHIQRRVDQTDALYPSAFRALAIPPKCIWIAGTMSIAAPPAVAIVGTRNATAYGIRAARDIASACARAGVCVVSGLARGIDGAAHEGALDANGRTVGVLGTGLDVVYPSTHRVLQQRIARDGLLITEMEAGDRGHRGTFPNRNRLIAALAQLVVVVEAPIKSGTHLTVEHAQALNINVAAVPGPIDVPQAAGSNQLLRDGAAVITHPDDVLALLSVDPSPISAPTLDVHDAAVWDALMQGAADVATLSRRAGISARVGAAALTSLEMAGLVEVDALGVVHSAR